MNTRLPRTALLARIADAVAPGVVLIEAPIGFGKSWLLRRAAPDAAVRTRGELGPLKKEPLDSQAIILDDAHLLDAADIRLLAQRIEDSSPSARLIVAGRILPDQLHEAAHLVDGAILDTAALSIAADEVVETVQELTLPVAEQVVRTADGSAKLIATALDQWSRQPSSDPVAIVSHLSRATNAAAIQQLDPSDRVLVSLLARAPGIDQSLLASLGGPGFLWRALEVGVPLRRQISGDIDVLDATSFRAHGIEPATATRLAGALVQRDRPIEAVGLLLDAGAHDKAARMLMELPESIINTVDPRALLAVLARLGSVTEREPGLLLLRANASAMIGRSDLGNADVDKAAERAKSAEPHVRRRVSVASARRLLVDGHADEAIALAEEGLRDLGPGEERTFARAHEVLADAASRHEQRAELQRAAEHFRVAATAWDGCGEHGRARNCRCDLAMTVLLPLGRFDEALEMLSEMLSLPGMTDAERSWVLTCEAFAHLESNRLDSAAARFDRAADLGQLLDNSRIVAIAAWGRTLIAARRDDVAATLRWIATAENTALSDFDELLGVPFLCDAATHLGALGELDLAEGYLARAQQRSAPFESDVQRASFIHACRRGVVGDVDAQLAVTRPAEWWRVLLVSALASARSGEAERAQELLTSAEQELMRLGFGEFAALGERRAHHELQTLLQRAPAEAADITVVGAPSQAPPSVPAGVRVRVIGGPMVVEENGQVIEIPAGNPQRVVGVVVANGGLASFDQLAEAMWPGEDIETGRQRLRNVLLRLRRGVGNVVVRSGSGVRLAPGVGCDLYEFERLAADALASARTDPDVAGPLAEQAVAMTDGALLADFEYEDWAVAARRSVEQQLIGLLDLLSVQAEDSGDLARAQALAERALRLDRYTDSRYVRLAELLTMQGRSAAAVAVLDDASEVARELGAPLPKAAKERRDDLIRRAASS
jgi:DNA-binding SARP family transcriptional activator